MATRHLIKLKKGDMVLHGFNGVLGSLQTTISFYFFEKAKVGLKLGEKQTDEDVEEIMERSWGDDLFDFNTKK